MDNPTNDHLESSLRPAEPGRAHRPITASTLALTALGALLVGGLATTAIATVLDRDVERAAAQLTTDSTGSDDTTREPDTSSTTARPAASEVPTTLAPRVAPSPSTVDEALVPAPIDDAEPVDWEAQYEADRAQARAEAAAINGATLDRLEAAESRWATTTGAQYQFGYDHSGEGMTSTYCVEAVSGGFGYDAPACPFGAEPGGETVESWFDRIRTVAIGGDDLPDGFWVDAAFDDVDGHPIRIVFGGGEVDGSSIEVRHFTFVPDDRVSDHPDHDACEAGDPDACERLGRAGEPQPASWDTGNGYSMTPDEHIRHDCEVERDHRSCYEYGARGL